MLNRLWFTDNHKLEYFLNITPNLSTEIMSISEKSSFQTDWSKSNILIQSNRIRSRFEVKVGLKPYLRCLFTKNSITRSAISKNMIEDSGSYSCSQLDVRALICFQSARLTHLLPFSTTWRRFTKP